MTPLSARETRVPLVTTVRELRDFCFPNGWKKRRDWPALRSALGRARDYAIPWVVGTTAGGWWPVAVRFAPGRNAQLDDLVILDVMLPPGCGVGPVIERKAGTGSTRGHVGAAVPGVPRGAFRRLATGGHAEASSTKPRFPPLERGRRKLLGANEGGPAAISVRCQGQAEPDEGRPGLRMGGPAGGRDPDPDGVQPGRPSRLVGRARGSGNGDRQGRASRGRTYLTGESEGANRRS